MDKINEICVNEAIIHVLDNHSDEPILNQYAMELNEDTYKFVLGHVTKLLKDSNLRYAKFTATDAADNEVKVISQRYLNGEAEIIQVSKFLACKLFEIMRHVDNASSCDLIVVSISTEFGPMLGIIKLNYIKNYTHRIEVIDNSVGINITPIETGLPAKKNVQKAAFIKPIREDGQEYDILVLDKDYIKSGNEYGANYFVSNFLGGDIIENDRDKTLTFMGAAESWTRSNLRENAAKAVKVRNAIKEELKGNDIINICELSNKLFPEEAEAQKVFNEFMKSNELEEFELDKDLLSGMLKKVKLKTNNDIGIEISEEYYKDTDKFEIIDNGDGSINILIKNISSYMEK